MVSCSDSKSIEKINSILELVKSKQKELKVFSKEEINNFQFPIIEVRTNGLIKQVLMLPISSRYNFTNYVSGSSAILTMNGSMVSKTNGMNTYLNSVETDSSYPLLKPTPISKWVGNYNKKYIFLTETYGSKEVFFNCVFKEKIEEKIEILKKELLLIKFEEYCSNDNKNFKNLYWVSEQGFVWKSKQLVSDYNIFATITILKP